MRYTYSRWSGEQEAGALDADDLMDALSDDLVSDGDVWNALQRVIRWGLQQNGEQRATGLQSLMQRLRGQRQEELARYSLDAMVEDLRDQVADIVQAERNAVERRMADAEQSGGDAELRDMLRSITEKKRDYLDNLPAELGPALSSLSDYEFLDETARAGFQALMDTLQQEVLKSDFQSMRQSLAGLSGEELDDLKDMLHDLNAQLGERMAGEEPDFRRFMEKHGRHFPGAGSLDELIQQLQQQASYMTSLLQSMSPEMRRELEGMIEAVLEDPGLRQELGNMAEALGSLAPIRRQPDYPFSGSESLSLEEALRLVRRLHDMDQLEKDMKRAQDAGSLDHLDAEQVRQVMGEDSFQAVDKLKRLTEVLEEAGYVQRAGGSFELTARGIRRIGHKALQDVFRHLKRDAFGRHAVALEGAGGDRADDSKPYEFGDTFLLDMTRTLMNAVVREGAGSPVRLAVPDFEVYRTEHLTQASTVLMLDMSRSMPLRGCFVAAKKVALALNSLIGTQFPRDRLYIIGFSDFARELRPETLHQITWGDYVYGTNMQHGLMMARRLLSRHKSANKQIILITDGEPTAHFEGDRVHFSYPPTFRTFQETLREVKRCTQDGIVINTFMLERSHYLADFVNQMTRINRGRAFFATPERLGDYILVDYVNNKANAHTIRGR